MADSTDSGNSISWGIDPGGILEGIASVANLFGQGHRAQEAANNEQARIAAEAAAQAQADAAKSAQWKQWAKYGGIGIAIIGAIIIVVILIQRHRA